jgi:hypothetical protein
MGSFDWMDLNGDGEVDGAELMLGEEMLCTGREEHEALFGDAGDFGKKSEDEYDELELAGLDRVDLEMMDENERREALEDAGLDPDDFNF